LKALLSKQDILMPRIMVMMDCEADCGKILSVSDVMMWLPELVAGLPGSEEEVVVTTNGRSASILTNVDDYE
jgi:hypothetical protein